MNSILKVSDACSLALHSMIVLASNHNRLLSVKEIASQLGVSANHLSKVMQRLSKSGLVTSIKGLNGGFKIAQDPKGVSFMNIYEAIEGEFKPNNCLLGNPKCLGNSACNMGPLVTSINQQIEDYFLNTRLSQFI